MPELRQNLATKEWVIIASERSHRPQEFVEKARRLTHERDAHSASCPFCPGNEHETPGELLRWPGEGPWKLRVFSNRYPALNANGARVYCNEGVQRKLSGVGAHEVLVETTHHNVTPALQTPEGLARTLKAFQTRGRELQLDSRIEYVSYFKNHGPAAGASLEHAHCQILGLPMVPHRIRNRIEELRRTIDDEGGCPLCAMLELEETQGERLVAVNECFVAFVLYAAFSPFHMWILPRRHGPTFLDQTPGELMALARIMREVLSRIYVGLNDPDFNWLIHSAPRRDSSSAYLHWYVSLIPRVTKQAGFELGSGMSINPALPEESARFLREVAVGEPQTDQFPIADLGEIG